MFNLKHFRTVHRRSVRHARHKGDITETVGRGNDEARKELAAHRQFTGLVGFAVHSAPLSPASRLASCAVAELAVPPRKARFVHRHLPPSAGPHPVCEEVLAAAVQAAVRTTPLTRVPSFPSFPPPPAPFSKPHETAAASRQGACVHRQEHTATTRFQPKGARRERGNSAGSRSRPVSFEQPLPPAPALFSKAGKRRKDEKKESAQVYVRKWGPPALLHFGSRTAAAAPRAHAHTHE